MKLSIFAIAMLCFIMTSCGYPIFARIEELHEQHVQNHFDTFDEAWYWVSHNIKYVSDPSGGNKKLPEETESSLCGDCEDFALLLACYANDMDIRVNVVEGYPPSGGMHAVCRYKGELIEPQAYEKKINNFHICVEYSYEDALYTYGLR